MSDRVITVKDVLLRETINLVRKTTIDDFEVEEILGRATVDDMQVYLCKKKNSTDLRFVPGMELLKHPLVLVKFAKRILS